MKLMKETEAVCIRVSSNDFLKGVVWVVWLRGSWQKEEIHPTRST